MKNKIRYFGRCLQQSGALHWPFGPPSPQSRLEIEQLSSKQVNLLWKWELEENWEQALRAARAALHRYRCHDDFFPIWVEEQLVCSAQRWWFIYDLNFLSFAKSR